MDLTDLLPQWVAIMVNSALYAYLLWLGVAFFRISQGKERLLVAGWYAAFLMAIFQNLDSTAAITIQYAKAFCYLTSFGAALFILVKTPASVNAPERLWDFKLPRANCRQVLGRQSEPAAIIGNDGSGQSEGCRNIFRATKSPSLLLFGLASALLAGGACVLSIKEEIIGHSNMLDGVRTVLPISLLWSGWVYWAYRVHGKRALWLLIAFPFAWLDPLFLALFVISSMLRGGGV